MTSSIVNGFTIGPRAGLSDANLRGADLSGANLSDAIGALSCGTPHGYHVVANVLNNRLVIYAGCRTFNLLDARAHWATREDRLLMLPLLNYIEAATKIMGWPT